MDVTPSTQQCYPITLQNFAAFVCNNSTTHHDQICKRLLSEPITASTNHKAHMETVLDGENGLTHFRPIRSAILRDGVTWCYPIRFPTVKYHLAVGMELIRHYHVICPRADNTRHSGDLRTIALKILRHNSNSIIISLYSDPNLQKMITSRFCTWHDSNAVVACTKTCSDLSTRNKVSAKRSFHEIWIVLEKTVCETNGSQGWQLGSP